MSVCVCTCLSKQEGKVGFKMSKYVLCCVVGLADAPLDGLTASHHQVLLSFLCDEVLDSDKMREALQERLDGEGEVKREMKGAVAEKKGELKVRTMDRLPPAVLFP